MAFIMNITDNKYLGHLVLGGDKAVKNGTFVVANQANGEAVIADATTGDEEVFPVENIIDTVREQGIDDLDFEVKPGEYLRLKTLQFGQVFTTLGNFAKGDLLAVGAEGKLVLKGERTPQFVFEVIETPIVWGVQCVKCLVKK